MLLQLLRGHCSKLLAVVATVLTIAWCVDVVDGYQKGVRLEREGGSAVFFDEVAVLNNLGASMLIAESASSLNTIERYLYGVTTRSDTLEYAEHVLQGIKSDGRLTEEGVVFLAGVQWASGDRAKAQITVAHLDDCNYSRSQTMIDLLAGKVLEPYQWEDLESDMQELPRDWVSYFLAEKIVQKNPSEVKNVAQLERLLDHRRQVLFASSSRISMLAWGLTVAGWVAIIFLARRKSRELPSIEKSALDMWPLSWVLVVFFVGEFIADKVPEGLFAWLAWSQSPVVSWFGQLGYFASFQMLGCLVMIMVLLPEPRWQVMKQEFFRPVKYLWLWVLVAYSATVTFDTILYRLPFRWFPQDPTLGFQWLEIGVPGIILGLITGVILAPIFEEIVFRGFLFKSLQEKLGLHLSALVSATVFAGVHFYGMQDLLAVGFFGLVMAYLYHFTKSLISCILCHALFNLIVITWSWYIERSPESWWAL